MISYWPGAHWLALQPRGSSCLYLPDTEIPAHTFVPTCFLCGYWESNSGAHACTEAFYKLPISHPGPEILTKALEDAHLSSEPCHTLRFHQKILLASSSPVFPCSTHIIKNRKSSGELGLCLVRAPASPEILPSLPLYYKLSVFCLYLAFYIGGGDLNSVPYTYTVSTYTH